MEQFRQWVNWGCLMLLGCAGTKGAPPRQGGATGQALGLSPAQPAVTCGPRESYEFVATKPLCPDGTNPFAGDVEKGRQSRKGSKGGQANGHLIDVYEVPCASGPRTVYVDMYGCSEYAERLTQLQHESSELTALTKNFDAGAFQKVLERCQGHAKHAPDEAAYCLWLVPAALEVLGRSDDALVSAQGVCRGMPAASPQSDARAEYVVMLLVTLSDSAVKGNYKPTADQRTVLPESFSARCGVEKAEVERVMNKLSGAR